MKIALRTLLIAALAAMPLTGLAGDTDSDLKIGLDEELSGNLDQNLSEDFSQDFEGIFHMGAWSADTKGSPDKVSEFEPDGGFPTLAVLVNSHTDGGSLGVRFNLNDSNDLSGDLDFDLGRMVRSHNTYNKFMHRFSHDEMANLEATSTNGKVVWHTDLDPMQEYGIDYQVFDSRTEFQFDMLSALTLAFEYRDQRRSGHKQAYTTSHCDTCHVYSQDHKVDERTRDAKIEGAFGFKGGSIVASWNHRTLNYGQDAVSLQFDDALHPEAQTPVFDNRLQYDSDVGVIPADLWSEQEKTTGRLDVNLNSLGGFAINLGGVLQDSKNQYTGYRADYKGFMLNAARAFGQTKRTRFRWRLRSYTVDTDDVWVDVHDRPSIAGPHAGLTYEDWTGQNFDFMRQSALNRDTFESRMDVSFRLSKALGTLRLAWDYLDNDREYYEVRPGDTKTTENILGLYWRSRPGKHLKLRAHYKHGSIDNPFMLVNGACSTLESGSNSNPWDPNLTAQYYEFQDARIADTTASPSSYDEFKVGLNWRIGSRSSLNGTYKYWDGDNQDGTLTDWSRSTQNVALTFWSAPTETISWYIGAATTNADRDAPICIPVFDG